MGEIVDFYSGLTYSPNNIVKHGTLVLRSSNVKENQIVTDDSLFVNSTFINVDNVNEGDIIVVVRNGSRDLIGKHAKIRQAMPNTVIGAFMTGIRFEQPDFLTALLDTNQFNQEIEKNLGATINQITINSFKNMVFHIPFKLEQTQIGNFFKQLDETIALHKRKLAKLFILKSAFLTSIFCTRNIQIYTRNPISWEQRKLGELGNIVMCKRIFKHQTNDKIGIPFYKIGTFGYVADAYISYSLYNEYKTKYPYPKKGDILISAAGTIGRTVVYNGEKAYYQDSNIVWLNINENKISNTFLKYFYKIAKWNGIEGSTIQRLYNFNILSTKIKLPSLEEQTQIGNFFKQLDETIALHKRKQRKYQQIKQIFLRKMLID